VEATSQPTNAVSGTTEAEATIITTNAFPPLTILSLELQGTNVSPSFDTVEGRTNDWKNRSISGSTHGL
jgi:hypothetical protein